MKLLIFWCCLLGQYEAVSQNALLFKKKNKTVSSYWQGMTIAFQTAGGQWQKGEITRISKDSFYIQPVIVRYQMFRNDTMRLHPEGFALSDVVAMPKKGVHVDLRQGEWQVIPTAGHVKWRIFKSGDIFRIGAAGYTILHIFNGLVYEKLSFADSKVSLGIAAAVFLGGVILDKLYKPEIKLTSRYSLQTMQLGRE